MGLINRCQVCHKNYTPHGMEDRLWITFRSQRVPLCLQCTGKLMLWLNNKKDELEEPEDGKEKQDT